MMRVPRSTRFAPMLALLTGVFLGVSLCIGAGVQVLKRPDMTPAVDRLLSIREPLVAIDGDTVKRGQIRTRLMGFDAPELKGAKCPAELELAYTAKKRLQELIDSDDWHLLPSTKRDKYGRDLATQPQSRPLSAAYLRVLMNSPQLRRVYDRTDINARLQPIAEA